jgi:hypothetical protein
MYTHSWKCSRKRPGKNSGKNLGKEVVVHGGRAVDLG